MTAVWVNNGLLIDYTADKEIARGDVVVLGERCGVAFNNAAEGTVIPVYIKGRFTVAAKTGTAIKAGAVLYYDNGTKTVSTAEGGVYMGIAAADMPSSGTAVDVVLV